MENIKEYKNYPVVKSNKLVEAKYKLTLNEIRLVYVVISQIKPEDEEFKKYCIKIQDILQMFEMNTNNYHAHIKKFFMDLAKKPIVIENENKKNDFIVANWFASAEYIGEKGLIMIELSQKLKPYLLQLKNHFTVYGLDSVLKLKSVYSIRIYEILLKEYCYYGKKRFSFIFSIKALKSMLGLEENEYPLFANFKVKVLDIAKRELKAKSDFYFEYKTIKTGRAITDIEFFVFNKEKKEAKKQLSTKEETKAIIDIKTPSLESKIEEEEINKKLIALGFQDYRKIRSDHSDEVLLDAFADLDFEIEYRKGNNKDGLKNIGAWVRKRLPKAGESFQRSLHHNKYLEEQEKKKQQEEIKLQEELKAKQEREKKEQYIRELDERINKKIEDLKLNAPKEWEDIEKKVFAQVSSECQPPPQKKEEKAIIERIIGELTEKDKKILELEAVEKAKRSLFDLGLTEEHNNFNSILKSVKVTTFESLVKERYSLEIESELKATSYYKAYEQRAKDRKNEIIRGIIINKLKTDLVL